MWTYILKLILDASLVGLAGICLVTKALTRVYHLKNLVL